MTNVSLAEAYLAKTQKRLKILDVLRNEAAFHGDIDFIPTERYTAADADRAIDDATFAVRQAEAVVQKRG